MSYYYNYFLGYKRNDNGLFYPLGPYDMNGVLHDVLSLSRSFASDLHELFYVIPKEKYSDKLKEEFTYKNCYGEEELGSVKWCSLADLPSGTFIKKGYFLIKDIEIYEKSMAEDGYVDTFDIFYDYIPCEIYGQMIQNELTFGLPDPREDEFGEIIMPRSCREYALYAYPNYHSMEYESFIIRNSANMYEFGVKELDDAQIVVLETEG